MTKLLEIWTTVAQDVSLEDVPPSEFTAWHRDVIYPKLNSFQGYDTLRFELTTYKEPEDTDEEPS